ncbi:MAG: hypothetical protein LBU97_03050 [Alistipes sp.]|jgi:hypothetical protein|nr:hypothetical protein [Alistipes sp.]
MKKIIATPLAALLTLTFTFAFAASAQAQNDPFLLFKEGAVAEYEIKGPGGAVLSYARSTVTAIDRTDDRNFTITINAEAMGPDRKAVAPATAMTSVVKNGTVMVAPNTMGMEIEGTLPSYPSDMAVGYTHEYSFTIKMMGMDAVTSGIEKAVARESVTTPAGTFDCVKTESAMTVKVMGQTQQMKVVSWIARGVGAVKTETHDNAGSLMASQTLVSLKK